MPGKIRPRNRLMFSDEIQQNAPVDVARRFAAGYLKIV
jgi:hypothetical protein